MPRQSGPIGVGDLLSLDMAALPRLSALEGLSLQLQVVHCTTGCETPADLSSWRFQLL